MMMRWCLAALLALGCAEELDDPTQGEIPFNPDRPSFGGEGPAVTPYTGDNPHVQEAQLELRTGLDLHRKVIFRTCGPTGGVCHNEKEYPDLHTPANFVAAFGAPCNVQSDAEAIYDRCELPGDRFELSSDWFEQAPVEIAYYEYVPPDPSQEDDDAEPTGADSPGLHLYFGEPITLEQDSVWAAGRFIRAFVNDEGIIQDLAFFSFNTRWTILDGGLHVVGRVRTYQYDTVQELLSVGVQEGDANRNGIFGAREHDPVALLELGKPDESYLIGRLRGTMFGEDVPGSRMPLANQPLSVAEMLALYCLVEGMGKIPAGAEPNLAWEIDYTSCQAAKSPESLNLLGEGVTWKTRISQILEFNCGGCHSGSDPPEGLNLLEGDVYTRLLQPSSQMPALQLVQPSEPMQSYLYLKLIGDPQILGSPMPFNPLTGAGALSQPEIDDVRTWIEAGAVEDE